MQLILENVRSFCGRHVIPTKPLTILVGENSSGKTTFLAMLALASSPWFPTQTSVSGPPYELGSYDTLATNRGGKRGQLKSFSLGYLFDPPESASHRSLIVTFSDDHGQPTISSLEGKTNKIKLNCQVSGSKLTGSVIYSENIEHGGTAHEHSFSADIKEEQKQNIPIAFNIANTVVATIVVGAEAKTAKLRSEIGSAIWALLSPIPFQSSVVSLAPVRTKPRRTYDELTREFRPEGDHIPAVLARMWDDETATHKKAFYDALLAFGKDSGLFNDFGVKKLGKKSGSPFQIMVKTGGPPRNLQDVGYGVSQVLPVFGDSVLTPKGSRLLLQQPEVHLHPRAQAALGTLFARLAASKQKEFVIETHSDYLLDRVRLEVARGTIPPESVQILFFEKKKIETKVHRLNLDQQGNLSNVPSSYRNFFLTERNSLFFRAK